MAWGSGYLKDCFSLLTSTCPAGVGCFQARSSIWWNTKGEPFLLWYRPMKHYSFKVRLAQLDWHSRRLLNPAFAIRPGKLMEMWILLNNYIVCKLRMHSTICVYYYNFKWFNCISKGFIFNNFNCLGFDLLILCAGQVRSMTWTFPYRVNLSLWSTSILNCTHKWTWNQWNSSNSRIIYANEDVPSTMWLASWNFLMVFTGGLIYCRSHWYSPTVK